MLCASASAAALSDMRNAHDPIGPARGGSRGAAMADCAGKRRDTAPAPSPGPHLTEWLCGRSSTKAGMDHVGHEDMLTSGIENGHGSCLNATAAPPFVAGPGCGTECRVDGGG